MTKILLPLIFIFSYVPAFAQSSDSYIESISSSMNCGGQGFFQQGSRNGFKQKICCAFHVKQAYDSLIARQERLDQEEPAKTQKDESYCDQIEKCYNTAYKQKKPVLDKIWDNYKAALKKSGEEFDAAYNPTVKRLEGTCYLEYNHKTHITRRVNMYGPSLVVIRLTNANNCLKETIKVTNELKQIYEELEESCMSQVMKNSQLMPLCSTQFWDPTDLYGTIAEYYETIKALKIEACGQPLRREDCCTVIPSKNG